MQSKKAKRARAEKIRRAQRNRRALGADKRNLRASLGRPSRRSGALQRSEFAPKRAEVRMPVPETFCFLTDPEGALKFVEEIERELSKASVGEVVIDFSKCKVLGLCAHFVLFTTVTDKQDTRWANPISVTAIPSQSPSVSQMLNAPQIAWGRRPANIIRSPMIRGKASNSEFSKDRDRAGTEIVDYLARCLATEDMELTPEGCKYIGNLITEAVGNAEEHSGPWVAAGYFVQQYSTDPGECHLVLFNLGATIAERIDGPGASETIRTQAQNLADHHLNRGFFTARFRKSWNREALLTLFALQEGVSSRLHERPSRGNGTIQMIKAFSELAGKDERMCIMSGSSYILFDGTYALSFQKTLANESREVIAFNREKNLQFPPDDRYVSALSRRFGGTIVSVRFKLGSTKNTELTKKKRKTDENI